MLDVSILKEQETNFMGMQTSYLHCAKNEDYRMSRERIALLCDNEKKDARHCET